ncbi:Peptidase S8/S53, subtilisin/kexin/sedolisin [Penicillium expansum]|uniref:Peptidase S8/S53, subtilisin/kexin/sedolisin n=1 Tax=Penicillium expansum TaxID=27334 RepID=A0A0A2JDA7_PENEN|nr:Peptidase S8/S53, subtilisin/kexin/sedolisin [Penicillium expansum]KGO53349.1 Peptidase S8/S53, subtilisin/kexin/sedolisin [Penicillium expansum]
MLRSSESVEAFFHGDVRSPQRLQQKFQGILRTVSAFARVDSVINSPSWSAAEDAPPDSCHEKDVEDGFIMISNRAQARGTHNEADTIDNLIESSRQFKNMLMRHETQHETLDYTAEKDFTGSNLHAEEVLGVPGDRVRSGLQTLFAVLVQQLQCCNRGHFMRLKMNGFVDQLNMQSKLFFDAYLSSEYIRTPPRWVRSKCTIATDAIANAEDHDCGFIDKAETLNKDLSILLQETLEKSSGDDPQEQFRVEYPGSQTAKIQLDGPYPLKSAAAPTKSLSELLNCVSNHSKSSARIDTFDRDMMCLNLALSLLHLSTTGWRRASWRTDCNTGDGIFFLRDPATQTIVDITKPYLSYALNDEVESEDDDGLSCDPQLLDFAKLILEIHRQEIIPLRNEGSKLSKRKLLEDILKLINDVRKFRGGDQMFKLAVKACLDAAGKEAAQDKSDKYRLQRYIFYKIVRPLDKYAAFPEFSTSVLEDSSVQNSEESQESPFDWETGHDTTEDKLPKQWDDKLGHGTMVTRLLMRVSPEAELFIAKVSSDTEHCIPKNKLYCIAEAINWAVQKWDVDIITMSLALQEENPDIDQALNEALDPSYDGATRKIVFAAAGNNSGGNARRSWPARKNNVIAVHVTDGLGTGVNINPSSEGDLCFATLGCGIEHTLWTEDGDTNIYISGTSFATPIAAGIAANVLEYARHRVDNLTETRKERLYSGGCMKKVFEAMSSKRGDCHYVQPWTFWNERFRGGWWRNTHFPIDNPDNIGEALKQIIAEY